MGVLEARKDAEKITYPVVGEKIKDADNVIDYDIREEITKDVSAEINANNQTTTGIATVIPGVNAPKLIESTSIISSPIPGYSYIQTTFQGSYVGSGVHQTLKVTIMGGMGGDSLIPTSDKRALKAVRDGVYKLEVRYGGGTSQYYIRYWLFQNSTQLDYQAPGTTDIDKEYTLEIKKGDLISVTATVVGYGSWSGVASPIAYIDTTRL